MVSISFGLACSFILEGRLNGFGGEMVIVSWVGSF